MIFEKKLKERDACVRILAESIAGLPLHVYEYRGNGKERVPGHPLYFLLHDSQKRGGKYKADGGRLLK